MDLSLHVRRHGHGAIVTVAGEIDRFSAGRLLDCAIDALREHGPRLAINLAAVDFMDCGGVEVLLAVRRRAELMGGQLWVVSPSRPVRRVLGILGVAAEMVPPRLIPVS